MKNILKITVLTILVFLIMIILKNYIVSAITREELDTVQLKPIKNINTVNSILKSSKMDYEKNSIVNKETKEDVLVVAIEEKEEKKEVKEEQKKDDKYTKVRKTSNGEKYTIIGELEIPKIKIKYNILSSTSVALLKVSLNRYWGAQPNEVGNMCVVGHNYLDSRFFGKLHKLTNGDLIKITDSTGRTLNYYVYDKFVADPYDTSCTTQRTEGRTEITLITCYNKGTQRLVVKARTK